MTYNTRSIHRFVKSTIAALMFVVFTSGVTAEQEEKPTLPRSQAASAATSANIESASPATEAKQDPKGLDPITVGPLEIIPAKTVVRVNKDYDKTCLGTVIRFKVRNTSAGDVKLAMFTYSIGAIDELGVNLFPKDSHYLRYLKTTGINLLETESSKWGTAYVTSKASYVLMGSKQVIEVQLIAENQSIHCIQDKDNEFRKTYKPKNMTFGASLSIVDAQESETVRSFSFSEAPIQIF
jgi:hypothetical protein